MSLRVVVADDQALVRAGFCGIVAATPGLAVVGEAGTGADAVEVTRLVGKMLIAYVHQHIKRPDLPFGGYYPLGVCQDSVAAIERKMTGHDTLFPNTAEGALWDDPRDAEINEMMLAIPKDRSGSPPRSA